MEEYYLTIHKSLFYTTTVLTKEVAEKLDNYCKKYALNKSAMIRLLINLGVDNDILSANAHENIKDMKSVNNCNGDNHE